MFIAPKMDEQQKLRIKAIQLLSPRDARGRLMQDDAGAAASLTPADAARLLSEIELGGMAADDFLVPVALLEALHVDVEAWNRLGIQKVHNQTKFAVAGDLAQWGILPVLEAWSGTQRKELHTLPSAQETQHNPLAR